ncbi:translation initiation factor IF-3, mitochondrial [Bombina bombina]|uniref:translation initiation factor IF-3, mitochondrial n=1 Tax=Bombina bombina TaxID=8345 RepID=UPI00235ADCED|nr:translation initiation factor IF-3, mitochondrial [Bombina bombina]
MSGLHLRKIICQATNNGRWYLGRHFVLPTRWFKVTTFLPLIPINCSRKGPMTIHVKTYTTTELEDEPDEKLTKKKKVEANARKTVGNVGRKIPYRFIHVFNENGEDLGNMHRADVIRIMDEQGLKLVPIRENTDPPVYKLLTGKQIHEEQIKLREKQKLSSHGPVQIKELSFSALIAKHDLDTKMKQVMHWIEKKHHVRITVQKGSSAEGNDKLDVLNQIAESLSEQATCVFKPKLIKEGRAAVCVLRPLSDKELREHKKKLQTDSTQTESTKSEVS